MCRTNLVLLYFLTFSGMLWADPGIVVIANKGLPMKPLSVAEMKAFFLGEVRFTESGQAVRIGERDRGTDLHRVFYEQIARMSPKDVSIYWAKKVFTGEGIAPTRIAGDDKATLEWVRRNADGISYIDSKNADGTVQILGHLP